MTTIAALMLSNPLSPSIRPLEAIDSPLPPTAETTTPHKGSGHLSRSSSQQNCDTDSGKSSCSPALLDCSFDSGIGGVIDGNAMQLQKRIQQCSRILMALQRHQDEYHELRERLSKIADKKTPKDSDSPDKHCNVCCAEINPDDVRSFVECGLCKKHICRGSKCADWHPNTSTWQCQLCESSAESLAQTSSWVAEQLSFNQHKLVYPMRARSEIYIPIGDGNDSSIQFESVSQIGVDSATITAEQKVKIREYVEEVVSKMLGGSLDSTAVSQLSKSENYLPAIVNGRHHPSTPPPKAEAPSDELNFAHISQARLRQLIEAIIAETIRPSAEVSEVELDTRNAKESGALPGSNGTRHRTEHYFEPNSYQDLLATAVLNKIVDEQDHGASRRFSESPPDLSGRLVDSNFNVENQSTTSGSSLEPRSDCSYTDTEHLLHSSHEKDISPYGSHRILNVDKKLLSAGRESALSDYIASHMVPLPDFSGPVTESEEDDYISETCSTLGEGTWEDNWLFKKKRPSTSISSSSVGMLVPAPKEDVRAQIGDKTADEVSDLSEIGSDSDELSLDLIRSNVVEPVNDRLLNKHLIGGKNTKIMLDELYDRTSMISTTSLGENEPKFTETKNIHVAEGALKTEAINTHIDAKQVVLTTEEQQSSLDEANGNPPSGSIAEREYKKWNNAVDMPNNPYAPEALKLRISGSQERFIDLPNISPTTEQNPISHIRECSEGTPRPEPAASNDCKRYSRDYYINDDKQSSALRPDGSTAHHANISDDPSTEHITINEDVPPTTPTTTCPTLTYQAMPARIIEDNGSLDSLSNRSLNTNTTTTTTSDDSDTVLIYDCHKQETTAMPKNVAEDLKQKKSLMDLPLNEASAGAGSMGGTPVTAVRGSTPTAFKFLQPKRRLIEPNQVLTLEEDEEKLPETVVTPVEKVVIEEEVAQVLPSVKALAQAFLLSASKSGSLTENKWKSKIHKTKVIRTHTAAPERKLEAHVSVAEIAEDATIASDLSSLETDPPTSPENLNATLPTDVDGSTSPVRSGFLKSNIAFFENLKFK